MLGRVVYRVSLAVGILSAIFGSMPRTVDSAAPPEKVGAKEIQNLLESRPTEILLLDVRTLREYRQGHIPGSVHIPMNAIPAKLSDIPADMQVVVVCASGARSGAVARYLRDRGYSRVANYEGGIADWQRRGLPLEP